MAVPGYYAGNALISYPFLAEPAPAMAFPGGAARLPATTVVELVAWVEPDGSYKTRDHSVRLASISRSAGVVTFAFDSTAPGLVGTSLRFRASTDEAPWTTLEATAVYSDGSHAPAGACGPAPLWAGRMVVGPLAPLLALLPEGGSATGAVAVETTLVKSLAGLSLRAIYVGNLDRTRFTSTPQIPGAELVVESVGCMTGDVRFLQGYNASLRQDAEAPSIEFSAAVGAGLGEPCEEVPLNDLDAPPDGGPFLSGGPSCREAITSISGVEGRSIRVVGGTGVTVSVDPAAPHRLLVKPAAADSLGCPQEA